MLCFEVIPNRFYCHKATGMRASLYGAHPASDGNTDAWEVVQQGWTIRDNKRNTVGIPLKSPWELKDDAQAWADEQNAKPWNKMA